MHTLVISMLIGLIAFSCAGPAFGAKLAPDVGATDRRVRRLTTTTGVEFGLLGRKPAASVPTVFWFGGAIDLSAVEIVPFLVERGYLCVSLDTPGHGKNRESGEPPDGMDAWRHRIEAKKNFIPQFNQKISKVLDYLIAEGFTDPDRVAVVGGSRGAFIAFHYAASDPRVKSVGGQIPLTELGHITEFKGMENDPLTKSLGVINLAEKFAGRNLLVIVGDNDARVGTDHAIAFARRVSRVAQDANVELHVLKGGHFAMEGLTELSEMWLAKHLDKRN